VLFYILNWIIKKRYALSFTLCALGSESLFLHKSVFMKKIPGLWVLIIFFSLSSLRSFSQCSICTRTAQQMGEKPGMALNAGILYLAFTPLAIGGILGYKWWRQNR
jgi:hypothetical protein